MKINILLPALCCGMVVMQACGPKTTSSTAPMADNSQSSLDWAGTYSGTLPCADCEGIETVIVLNKDNTYRVETNYKGKSTQWSESKGSFSWNAGGNKITLKPEGDATTPLQYAVGEGHLKQLDQQGNVITGNLANNYVLNKDNSGIREKYWKLIRLNGTDITEANRGPKEAYMILKAGGNRVQGNGSCNGFGGTYTMEGPGRVRFSKLASTMMACPNMETETGFYRALETADNYTMRGDTLSLNKARMAPLAVFKAMPGMPK